MIIKKIILENIRSYEKEEISFNQGSTLLSGDIGSGKTSVLLAIEFALFGLQPGQKGSSLLRNGKDEGKVIMCLDIDGNEITIERSLKKGKSISQESCFLTINNERKEFSVSELKNKILSLLSYPQEFAKKQNILYTFTVYTPQEQMKEIILEDPEVRINTLRHIFGIDKYKRILENLSVLTSKLREEKRIKENFLSLLEQNVSLLELKEKQLLEKSQKLPELEKLFQEKKLKRKEIESEKEDLSNKIEERNKLKSEIEKTNLVISNKRETIFSNKKIIDSLEKQILELKDFHYDENFVSLKEKELLLKKEEKEKISSYLIEINSKIVSNNNKISENLSIKKKISTIDICPTCLQDVAPVYKANISNKLDSEIIQSKNKIEELEKLKKENEEKLKNINLDLSKIEKEITNLQILKVKLENIKEKEFQISSLEKNNQNLEKDISLLEDHLSNLNKSVFDMGKFENLFQLKEKEFQNSLKEERLAEINLVELTKEIQILNQNIEEIKLNLLKYEKIKKEITYISNLENWLSKQFSSLISFIEKNVMIKLRSEFSKLFSEWFSILVPENFEIRLDEEFSPIIEQQDYELEYNYLSGGEKTAIALAYRLALNQVINSMFSKLKTKGLLILDEPTDGFSDQQLDKMRDVLQQLNVNQLIIVSHEQKMESFVENIIKFKKENWITKIEYLSKNNY
jgi:exonuclease SbcC